MLLLIDNYDSFTWNLVHYFDELGADWEGAIARCYADLGLTLTPGALAAMRKQMAASETGHHHAHSAQLARFAEAG